MTVNTVLHYVVPIMMVLGWLLFGPRPRVTASVLLLGLAWPVVWVAWTLIHGEASGWYPYGFIDAATHGYVRVLRRWGDRRLPPTKA